MGEPSRSFHVNHRLPSQPPHGWRHSSPTAQLGEAAAFAIPYALSVLANSEQVYRVPIAWELRSLATGLPRGALSYPPSKDVPRGIPQDGKDDIYHDRGVTYSSQTRWSPWGSTPWGRSGEKRFLGSPVGVLERGGCRALPALACEAAVLSSPVLSPVPFASAARRLSREHEGAGCLTRYALSAYHGSSVGNICLPGHVSTSDTKKGEYWA